MKKEKPVRVEKRKNSEGHASETRIFAREIHETFCDDKRCKFYGRPAQQGICHTAKPDAIDWDRIRTIEQEQEAELKYFRKLYRGRKYIGWLEAMYSCVSLNQRFTLDDLVRLRRDNALLRLKVARRKVGS